MKKFAATFIAALALARVAATASAQNHGGGSHGSGGGGWHGDSGYWGPRVGISFGFPGYWPAYYPYAYGYPYGYGYYDYPVYADPAPQVYIQRETGAIAPDSYAPAQGYAPAPGYMQRQPSAPAAQGEYSYYCTNPAGYYPQVANCSQPWLKVVPDASPTPGPH